MVKEKGYVVYTSIWDALGIEGPSKEKEKAMEKSRAKNKEKNRWRRRSIALPVKTEYSYTTIYLDGNETVAEVDFGIFDDLHSPSMYFTKRGKSSCMEEDEYDPKVGLMLAVGRAYVQIGEHLIKRAEGIMRHKEDVSSRVHKPLPKSLKL